MLLDKLNILSRYLQPLKAIQPLQRLAAYSARPLTTRNAALDQQPQVTEISEEEWANAKEYKEIPGPSAIGLMLDFLPGGELYGANFLKMYQTLRQRHGDIFLIRGSFGRSDLICTYNPVDFEKIYRTEGVWPTREGLSTIKYYRQVKNPRRTVVYGVW
ncbi:unnamed protein product [Ceratitis capitata]|uniref:(Mediterranean fruit fly) hypothetical protein n=1 Tax=Ceratitis capitata TaxID=7213 RepID=A0A811VI00_CERCA|nr:unnamed protein product [Ceratitis capitata]